MNKPFTRENYPHLKPEQICRVALITVGVPHHIVDELLPGRKMDYWVHLAVVKQEHWMKVAQDIRALEKQGLLK